MVSSRLILYRFEAFLRYALFSDIHSNLEALEAIIADAGEADVQRYICLGDLVGYNADPGGCVQRVQELDCPVIKGNHDEAATHDYELPHFNPLAMAGIDYTRRELDFAKVAYLESLPMTLGFKGFVVVHASMHQPQNWQYVHSEEEVASCIKFQPGRLCFIGHTHLPMIYYDDSSTIHQLQTAANAPTPLELDGTYKYLVNVGSVGQPRDGDWRACYVIFDDQTSSVEFRRVPYDVERTQRKIVDAGLPEVVAKRLMLGR